MSLEYAEKRIQQALDLTRGNMAKARQQVIAWCMEDMKLLQALTRPHMTGIVAHAINRVASRKTEAPIPEIDPQDDDARFGLEVLKAIAEGGSPKFGQENSAPPVKRQQASQRHIDAIRQMVAARKNTDK